MTRNKPRHVTPLVKDLEELQRTDPDHARQIKFVDVIRKVEDLQTEVLALMVLRAVEHSKESGYPENHLHHHFYDRLQELGARMVEFKRVPNAA